jgi:hypothetical protein
MKLIETKTLSTAVSSVSFTNIPQSFDDLLLVSSVRNTATNIIWIAQFIELNGTSVTSNSRFLDGNGGSATSYSIGGAYSGYVISSNATANTFSSNSVYIPNYRSSIDKALSVDTVSENNGTSGQQSLITISMALTSPVTQVRLFVDSNNYVVGSTFSLYGITKGSSGGVTAS